MPIVDFPLVVSPGIMRDIEPHRLPTGIWSNGLNMHFRDNKAEKAFGFATFIDAPTVAPKGLFFAPLNNTSFWAYPGLAAIYAFDRDGTKADITGGTTPTGDESDLWTYAYLNGIAIFNNGKDDPQQWVPSLGNNCADLSNWPAATVCRTMRSFLQYLVALDVTKSGVRSSQMVKWSHGAAAGSVPSSWDETDTTVDAGEFLLSATPGIVLDCLPLGNTNILYKEDSVYGMTFIGGQLVFGFQQLFEDFGLLARDAVVSFGRKHFVVTNEDILVHNGIQAESVVDARNRKWFFDKLSEDGRRNTFCVNVRHRSEIWTFFPMSGAGAANMVMIYNTEQKSTTFREIPHTRFAVYSPAMRSVIDDSWDEGGAGADTWGYESTLIWDKSSEVKLKPRFFMINEDENAIEEFDEDIFQDVGVDKKSYLERQTMPFIGPGQNGQMVVDLQQMKFFTEIWPHITGAAGVEVLVHIGTQNFVDEAVVFQPPKLYIIHTTEVLPIYLTARFLTVRFEATGSDPWELHGFSYEVTPLGSY